MLSKQGKKLVKEQLVYEENRLATYDCWPFDESFACNPRSMAEAGFYKSGRGSDDTAICFLCGKQMDEWGGGDQPWAQHKDKAKFCIFTQLGKPEKDLTVQEFLKVLLQFNINAFKEADNKHMEDVEGLVNAVKTQMKNAKFLSKLY